MVRWIVFLAGILGAIAVVIGSFAAHGLEKSLAKQALSPIEINKRVAQCEVGVRYHLWHTLAILALGCISKTHTGTGVFPGIRRTLAVVCMLVGIVLFSGGLYSMSILGITGHWAIVPSGGGMLILGWLGIASMAIGSYRD